VIGVKYKLVLFRDSEVDCYIAVVPSLPGCMTQGKTVLEAMSRAEEAAKLWIEYQTDSDISIPDQDFISDEIDLKKRLEILIDPQEIKYFKENYLKGEK
jgi:predicted RNase H-like HicB family nuclease